MKKLLMNPNYSIKHKLRTLENSDFWEFRSHMRPCLVIRRLFIEIPTPKEQDEVSALHETTMRKYVEKYNGDVVRGMWSVLR